MTRDDLIATLAVAPRRRRLTLLLKLIPQPGALIAKRAGISRATLYREATMSLVTKLRVARVLRVPASVIWPELQTLAWELLYGFRGDKKR
jgi:hypothetical protein